MPFTDLHLVGFIFIDNLQEKLRCVMLDWFPIAIFSMLHIWLIANTWNVVPGTRITSCETEIELSVLLMS